MKLSTLVTTLTLFVPGPVVLAADIINGDFEDPAPVHPEWDASACQVANAPHVAHEGQPHCSYAQLGPLAVSFCDRQSLSQDFTAACSEVGAFVTVQFDLRSYFDLPGNQHVELAVGGQSTRRVLPFTGFSWQTYRVSLPASVKSTNASVAFRIANQLPGMCGTRVGVRIDLDNVRCYATAEDVTDLCDQADPFFCACITCTDEADGLPGAGQDCDSDPACPGDHNGDCEVGNSDLLLVLSRWGMCDSCDCCAGDGDGDCSVGFTDMLEVLSSWGPCSHEPCASTVCP